MEIEPRPMWVMLIGLCICLFQMSQLTSEASTNFTYLVALMGLSGFFLLGPYSMAAGCLSLDIAGPKGAGTCTGILDGMGYVGGALAAWGAGWLSDHFGWAQVFHFSHPFRTYFFSLCLYDE